MKRAVWLLCLLLMLTGCGRAQTFEFVTDEAMVQTAAQPAEVYFQLAQEPAMPAMESDAGKLYLCGDYDVMLQTLQSGDLGRTVEQVSGFDMEDLTLIQTGSGEIKKYEFVWTTTAEEGAQIGRATVLDDGNYHYVLSSTVAAEKIEEYQEIWNGIFESFKLT